MRDAISGLIGRYDQLGRYFDRPAIDSINAYLDESTLRIQAVELINGSSAEIVREASQRLFRDEPDLLLPGGNAYTTRRLAACLRDMAAILGPERPAALCRELTKKFEEVRRGPLASLAAELTENPVKGEIVLVVDRRRSETVREIDLERDLRLALKTHSVRDAADIVSRMHDAPRRAVYQMALKLGKD